MLAFLTASLAGRKMCGRKSETCSSIFCRPSSCHSMLAALLLSALVPAADDAPKPSGKVTQQLLNSIHVTPKGSDLFEGNRWKNGNGFLLYGVARGLDAGTPHLLEIKPVVDDAKVQEPRIENICMVGGQGDRGLAAKDRGITRNLQYHPGVFMDRKIPEAFLRV